MLPRWLRRESDFDSDAFDAVTGTRPRPCGADVLEPVTIELSQIVGTLLAQAAWLQWMIQRGDGGDEYRGDRDTIVGALEQTRARVEEAQLVLLEVYGRRS